MRHLRSQALQSAGLKLLIVTALAGCAAPLQADITWEQTVSREHPVFQVDRAELSVGLDGRVYLSSMDATGMANPGYVLRLSLDGNERQSGTPGAAVTSVTANADGVVASTNAHFVHAVTLYSPGMKVLARVATFDPGNRFNAPAHVEAAPSGDFYAVDQVAARIVRLNPRGEVVKTYSYPQDPAGEVTDFRVDENHGAFILQNSAYRPLRRVGFDGQLQWTVPPAPGGFDLDSTGRLLTAEETKDVLHRYGLDGKPLPDLQLNFGDLKPTLGTQPLRALRVWKDQVIIKRLHPRELFLRFSLATGALQTTVPARFERLAVTVPSDLWTAGSTVPFQIEFQDSIHDAHPRWRVWARTIGALDYAEFPIRDGHLAVPPTASGLFQIKVTPEVQPWQRDLDSEYCAQGWVEIRQPGSIGSANLWTPKNRTFYGRGEAITFSALIRSSASDNQPLPATLRLTGPGSPRPLLQEGVTLQSGKAAEFQIPPALSSALLPGPYRLELLAPGFTSAGQPLQIGPGIQPRAFRAIHYGDYEVLWPNMANATNAPDLAASWAAREASRGINLLIERLGAINPTVDLIPSPSLLQRLKTDPSATAPEKAVLAHPFLQTLAAQGALGNQQMSILLNNDQGLPMGSDYGGPPPTAESREKFKSDQAEIIRRQTRQYSPYPAFRGWSWAANWWLTDSAKEPSTKEGKVAFETAVKQALATGKWNPLIDQVTDTNLGYAPAATAWFNQILRQESPSLKTAVAAPYRNGQAHPPLSLGNVDEVDLQAQWEQIAPPAYAAHNVDYYERPGRPSLAHPEVWNDSGTGEQVFSTLFSMWMRGAHAMGYANHLLNWYPEDSRSAQGGTASTLRAINALLTPYGPWAQELVKQDQVAIVVSTRMIKLDAWNQTTFRGMLEAYLTCMHAHHPASFVFSEDLKPGSLNRCKAVLLVGQKVELEPPLQKALLAAKASGAQVLYDGTCRPDLMAAFRPLGVSFDRLVDEHGLGVGGDESAYPRMLAEVRHSLPKLRTVLDAIVPPVARLQQDQVWITERANGQGRYLFLVNNTLPDLDPEYLWRVNLYSGSVVPVQTNFQLTRPAPAIYDVFAQRRVTTQNGVLNADLRAFPGRIYALLPAPLGAVALRGPQSVAPGRPFQWWTQVRDTKAAPISSAVPVRVRLKSPAGQVLEERYLSCPPAGSYGTFTVPLGTNGGKLSLEATELFSGLTSSLDINVLPLPTPLSFAAKPTLTPASVSGKPSAGDVSPVISHFGPHIRDLALTGDGKTAVLNTFNWDDNLFGLDLATGRQTWRRKVGQYFSFQPVSTPQGFAVQGFDFNSPEGYHLYLGNSSGQTPRRFALYGVPPRLPFRMYPAALHDRVNNFLVSPDGERVVAAGDLGLALWNQSGQQLWTQHAWNLPRTESRYNPESTWNSTRPNAATLLTADSQSFFALQNGVAIQRQFAGGKEVKSFSVGDDGYILRARAAQDGARLAVLTETNTGQITLLENGRLLTTIPAPDPYDFELTPDGSQLAVLRHNLLNVYDGGGGLRWTFSADDRLRFARFSSGAGRIVACADSGTVSVFSRDGQLIWEKDLGALAVPQWLPDGDLLLGTWEGRVERLTPTGKSVWSSHLQSRSDLQPVSLLAPDPTPTTRVMEWGNAEKQPWPLTPNLLSSEKAAIRIPTVERVVQNDYALLTDGKPDAPANPWIFPGELNQWAGLRFFNPLTMEFKSPVEATALTLVEDSTHPASWLRDADLEYWDEAANRWVFLQPLLSNSAIHTHRFAKTIRSSKFRILLPFGLYGNLRLSEIVLHP